MLISTIIPIYNAELFLNKCLDSLILSKKHYNAEIILINDGSIDNSLKICLDYQARFDFIKVFNQKNSGPSVARNKGLELANGEYICFVDSDDYVENDYFDVIFKNINQSFDILIFGFNKINGNQIIQNNSTPKILDRKDVLKLISLSSANMKLFWFPVTKVYTSSLLKEMRFNNKINIGEDTIFNIEAFVKAEKIKIIENCIYNYVNNENSLTQAKFKADLLENMEEHFNNRLTIHKRFVDINSQIYYEDIAKYYINHILFWLLSNLFNNPNKKNPLNKFKEIRNSKIYEFSFHHYKNNFGSFRKNVIILLFYYRFFKVLNFYYKNA